jgi:hypothetical protein
MFSETQKSDLFDDAESFVKGSEDVLTVITNARIWFKDALLREGCEHLDEILAIADKAIDKALDLIDIPNVPEPLESMIDKWIADYGKSLLRKLGKKLCPVKVEPPV